MEGRLISGFFLIFLIPWGVDEGLSPARSCAQSTVPFPHAAFSSSFSSLQHCHSMAGLLDGLLLRPSGDDNEEGSVDDYWDLEFVVKHYQTMIKAPTPKNKPGFYFWVACLGWSYFWSRILTNEILFFRVPTFCIGQHPHVCPMRTMILLHLGPMTLRHLVDSRLMGLLSSMMILRGLALKLASCLANVS